MKGLGRGVGIAALAAVGMAGLLAAGARAAQNPPPQEPQRPTFRAAANFVSVDAIPTGKDGRVIKGLTAQDFEIREDGKPQKVESIEFVEFETWPIDSDRRDPSTQRAGFDLASDPRYRVYVLYLENVGWRNCYGLQQPILEMLQKMLGPRDLFGLFLAGYGQSAAGLTLGQRTEMVFDQIQRHCTASSSFRMDATREEVELARCFGMNAGELINLRRADQTYLDLEGLVTVLGSIRQERKNIIYLGAGPPTPKARAMGRSSSSSSRGPQVGVTRMGTLSLGRSGPGEPDRRMCDYAESKLASIDFDLRFRDLMQQARRANVAFYTVDTGGLLGLSPNRSLTSLAASLMSMFSGGGMEIGPGNVGSLRALAENTDGLAVGGTNDLRNGLQKIANDLSSYYLLGYYSASTNWHGKAHRIDVRLTSTGDRIRSRREYRAPTLAELAPREKLSPLEAAERSAINGALGQLAPLGNPDRLRAHGLLRPGRIVVIAELPPALASTTWATGGRVEVAVTDSAGAAIGEGSTPVRAGGRSALVEVALPEGAVGPWKARVTVIGAGRSIEDRLDVRFGKGTLLGEVLIFRATPAPASPLRPVGDQFFRRTERVHLEWPLLTPLDRIAVRLLDQNGKALPVVAPITERPDAVVVDINLAPFTVGDYIIELVAGSGTTTERKLVAIRVAR